MLYSKRQKFNELGKIVGKIFSKICPYPNAWTLFGFIPSILTFYYLGKEEFFIAAGVFSLMSVIDFIDGSVARETNKASNYGAYLDTVADRVTEFIVLAGLFFVDYPDFIMPIKSWIFLFLFSSLMTTYVKAAAFEKKIVNKEVKGGLLERGERMILIFLIIIFSGFILEYAAIMIAITTLASLLSAFQRFFIATRNWRSP